ncbi:hypothetical protein [Streptomyces fungicidicus]|uniref:hypothetical protein n=1 Tax=Streptomyces fungicidicus TaxID=68203 RepID=UPI0036B7EC44
MKRHTFPLVTATLLLTACAAPADKPATPSASPTRTKPDAVDLSLPTDMNLVFDWEQPKDDSEAAAMDDAANFFRGIYRGVDKRTTKDAAVAAYATGDGLNYANTQINAWIDGGWTATGTLRHYDATTRSTANGTSVEVAFCADSGEFYGKEIRTGKVLRTEPGIEDFDHYKVIMVKVPTGEGLWQASKVYVETKAAKCR